MVFSSLDIFYFYSFSLLIYVSISARYSKFTSASRAATTRYSIQTLSWRLHLLLHRLELQVSMTVEARSKVSYHLLNHAHTLIPQALHITPLPPLLLYPSAVHTQNVTGNHSYPNLSRKRRVHSQTQPEPQAPDHKRQRQLRTIHGPCGCG